MTDRVAGGWRIATDTIYARAVHARYVRPYEGETMAETADRLERLKIPRPRGLGDGPWTPFAVDWIAARSEPDQTPNVDVLLTAAELKGTDQ